MAKPAAGEADVSLRDEVQKAALAQRHYGYRRIAQVVKRKGVAVGESVVRRILQSDNLLAIRRHKFKATTDYAHGYTVYPNYAQYLLIKASNQLWVADITYLRLGRGVPVDQYTWQTVSALGTRSFASGHRCGCFEANVIHKW